MMKFPEKWYVRTNKSRVAVNTALNRHFNTANIADENRPVLYAPDYDGDEGVYHAENNGSGGGRTDEVGVSWFRENGYQEVTERELLEHYGEEKDRPETLPEIKTEDALKAMESCDDIKRTFKTLWPTIFGDE
jgi:hypothetical protein